MLYKLKVFVLAESYSISPIHLQRIMKKALFLCFLRSLLIFCLITLSLAKETIVLEKSLKKVLNFGSKHLYESCINASITNGLIYRFVLLWRLAFSGINPVTGCRNQTILV